MGEIKKTMQSIVDLFDRWRGAGHTRAVISGACSTKGASIIVVDPDHHHRMFRQIQEVTRRTPYPCSPPIFTLEVFGGSHDGLLQGVSPSPILLDSHTITTLFRAAIEKISDLEGEAAELRRKFMSLSNQNSGIITLNKKLNHDAEESYEARVKAEARVRVLERELAEAKAKADRADQGFAKGVLDATTVLLNIVECHDLVGDGRVCPSCIRTAEAWLDTYVNPIPEEDAKAEEEAKRQ